MKAGDPGQSENANQNRKHCASTRTTEVWLPIGGRQYGLERESSATKDTKKMNEPFSFSLWTVFHAAGIYDLAGWPPAAGIRELRELAKTLAALVCFARRWCCAFATMRQEVIR
jgi:hypothetical protein